MNTPPDRSKPQTAAPLPVVRIARIAPAPEGGRWLVDGLVADQAVGFIGGAPKTGKTWLGLDLAVAVAAGVPALGRFPVRHPGPVLLYTAEDPASAVRDRVAGIAAAAGVDLERLAVGLITEPALRLDLDADRDRLAATLAKLRPRLLILDPLVRLHRVDENSSADISDILGFLRQMQRQYATAILLVHHVRKSGPGDTGQALRGSGDLHAWGDSNLYVTRQDGKTILVPEHRAHPPTPPVTISIRGTPPRLLAGDVAPMDPDARLDQRVLEALDRQPLARTDLREKLKLRNETLGEAIARLLAQKHIVLTDGRFARAVPA